MNLMFERVSQKDIAGQAGVSQAVVSQVLNNRKSTIRISDETVERVRETAKKLGYVPDHAARSLRTRRTQTIGVIVRGGAIATNELDIAEEYASQRGYELLLAVSRWNSTHDEHAIRRLLQRGIDGLLVLSPSITGASDQILDTLVEKNFPVVGFGPTLAEGIDFVDWDRRGAFRQLTEHLFEQGCRRFAFAAYNMTPGIQGRIDGINSVLQRVGIGTELKLIGCRYDLIDMSNVDRIELMSDVLSDFKPDAVLCYTDFSALAVINAARRIGLNVPSDLAVTGCSNQRFSELLDVPLTTVAMPHEKMITIALSRIIERIENKKEPVSRLEQYVHAEVIIRESSLFGRRNAER